MYNLRLVNYFDVYGNKKEGYEVNNLCVEAEDLYSDSVDNKSILKLLKMINFLKKDTRINQIIFEDYGEIIELYEKKSLCPICRIEIIRKIVDDLPY